MTKTTTPSPKRREEGVAKLTVNPFLDAEFYARMRDYTERDAAIIKELKAIAEIRAGNKQPDPRLAPSLQALRDTVKKGLSFGEMLDRMAAGKEKGLWEPWMTTFGIEIRAVNYGAGPASVNTPPRPYPTYPGGAPFRLDTV